MPQSAEELLIQQAKAGGVDAWEQLIVRYQGSLQDYIQYRYDHCLSAHISPEDILQETLLQAWLDIKSLKQTAPASFIAWLKAVADRRVCDALKSQQRLKRGGQLRRATNWIARRSRHRAPRSPGRTSSRVWCSAPECRRALRWTSSTPPMRGRSPAWS